MRRMTMEEFLWALHEVRDEGVAVKRLRALEEAAKAYEGAKKLFETVEAAEAAEDRFIELKEQYKAQLSVLDKEHKVKMEQLDARYKKLEAELNAEFAQKGKQYADARQMLEQVAYGEKAQQKRHQDLNDQERRLSTKQTELEGRERALKAKADQLDKLLRG